MKVDKNLLDNVEDGFEKNRRVRGELYRDENGIVLYLL